MKIGIDASSLRMPYTGIGQVSVNFIKELTKLSNFKTGGFEFILYLEEDADLKLPENFKKRVFLPFWKRDDLFRSNLWHKYSLPKRVKEDQCDIFLSLYQATTILPTDIKHIMIVHDVILELFSEYLNNSRKRRCWNLTKKAIKKVDKIIAVSSRTEKDLIQHLGISPEKISVIYPDVDDIYEKEISDEKSRKVLKKYGLKSGYIYNGGGLDLRKNTEALIRAYGLLIESNKKLHFIKDLPNLVISGKMMPELAPLILDVEKLVRELNLSENVILLGLVPQEDLPVLYKNAEVFIYPSLYEGFGLPVLEAMNVGIPVITSKKSSLPEVGSDAVLYCNPEEINDIAMVLRNVLLHEHIREELRRRGKERAKYFSWEKFAEKLFRTIENI